MNKKLICSVAITLASAVFTTGAWAANFHISDSPAGISFSGDGNFSVNDWVGGTATQTQVSPGYATFSGQIYNPNGTSGSLDYQILDPNGALSDVFSFSLTDLGNSVFDVNAAFCSFDDANACFKVLNPMTTTEGATGGFTLDLTSLDPNLAAQGTSVPEPTTLALFGIGLAGIGLSRRKKA